MIVLSNSYLINSYNYTRQFFYRRAVFRNQMPVTPSAILTVIRPLRSNCVICCVGVTALARTIGMSVWVKRAGKRGKRAGGWAGRGAEASSSIVSLAAASFGG